MDSVASSRPALNTPAMLPVASVEIPSGAIQVEKNRLFVVASDRGLQESVSELFNKAKTQSQDWMPSNQPDGLGVVLVFHTEKNNYVLGGIRENPSLKNKLAEDGSNFPPQISTSVGGRLDNPDLPLKDAAMNILKYRILPITEVDASHSLYQDQELLKKFALSISEPKGWDDKVCFHTSSWVNSNGSEGKMNYVSVVKHITCNEEDCQELTRALESSMSIKAAKGEPTRTLQPFNFVPLEPIIENSNASYALDELDKATQAYAKYQNQISLTFNDMAMAVLSKNGAFDPAKEGGQI
jgi:hypothetical protein